jgi:hypothetical protein
MADNYDQDMAMDRLQELQEGREEYYLDEGTAIEAELELDSDAAEVPDQPMGPWNPEQIRVNTKQFSMRNVLDMIEESSIELAPDFQRGQVWKLRQKSRLIESVLLQIPLPAFYFAEDSDGNMRVVDGLQRLSTIRDFVRGDEQHRFGLYDLEYLDLASKRFSDLPAPLKRRIHNAQITVHVIDPTTPPGIMYDIFKRINTGGTPLNAQEIRHCMSKPRSREILKRMTALPEFNQATNGLGGHIRMNDREMALRFAAFDLLGVSGYAKDPSMDAFLQRANLLLDDPKQVDEQRVESLLERFRTGMSNAYLVFGSHAFRKWPREDERRNPVNRALLETWGVTLSGFEAGDLQSRKDEIIMAARDLMTSDVEYLESITSSTSGLRRVRYRFSATEEAVRAGL